MYMRSVFKYFLWWRVCLFLIAFLSIYLIPQFGNTFPYVDRVLKITNLPDWIWGFGNFDGVHYLRIAQNGYDSMFTQSFFPLFPILINIFSNIFPNTSHLDINFYVDPTYFYSGIILSNLFFVFSLLIYYKLLNIEFDRRVATVSLLLLLIFPTSFYFGSIYTESLFLFLMLSSIIFMKKNKFFLSSVFISLATMTRVIGVFLIPIYIFEAIKSKKKLNLLWLSITVLGILGYMYYLQMNFNDPLSFFNSQSGFGNGRETDKLIFLPQVFYRYLKIFSTTQIYSLPFFTALLEFMFTIIPLGYLVLYIKKMNFGYWLFSFFSLIISTTTGTLTSMPRYALLSIILVIPYVVSRVNKVSKVYILLSIAGLVVLTMLFIRGYWVA